MLVDERLDDLDIRMTSDSSSLAGVVNLIAAAKMTSTRRGWEITNARAVGLIRGEYTQIYPRTIVLGKRALDLWSRDRCVKLLGPLTERSGESRRKRL